MLECQIECDVLHDWHGMAMTEREAQAKRAELERLLNDPVVRMDAHRVWQLLAELRDMAELSALAG